MKSEHIERIKIGEKTRTNLVDIRIVILYNIRFQFPSVRRMEWKRRIFIGMKFPVREKTDFKRPGVNSRSSNET